MDVSKMRELVALDENNPLSRFALGQALMREGTPESLAESAEHLTFANEKAPEHLASYHVLGQVLIRLGRTSEARDILTRGCRKIEAAGECMGQDLGPVMAEMLRELE